MTTLTIHPAGPQTDSAASHSAPQPSRQPDEIAEEVAGLVYLQSTMAIHDAIEEIRELIDSSIDTGTIEPSDSELPEQLNCEEQVRAKTWHWVDVINGTAAAQTEPLSKAEMEAKVRSYAERLFCLRVEDSVKATLKEVSRGAIHDLARLTYNGAHDKKAAR